MGRRTLIEAEREYNRQYRLKNRERVNYQQTLRRRAKGIGPPYRRTVEDTRAYWRKQKRLYRGREKKAKMTLPRKDTLAYIDILKQDPCSYCDNTWQATDHIASLNNDGEGDWTNLTSTCKRCNSRKQDRSLLEFLLYLQRIPFTLR